jgi:hypothetical protein
MAQVASRKETGKSRFYTLDDGSQYPSVTTILSVIGKPALINWAANMERELVINASADLYEDLPGPKFPKMSRPVYITTLKDRLGKEKAHVKELARAGDIGTQVHARIEWEVRKALGQKVGDEPVLQQEALSAFSVWQEWSVAANFRPLLCEQAVFSKKYQYAGTMDLMAEMRDADGKMIKVIVDWKTGKAIYDEALLQNTAYIQALIEMEHAQAPINGLIVRLPKTGTDPKPETRLISWAEQEKLFRVFQHVRALWGWQHENEKAKGFN